MKVALTEASRLVNATTALTGQKYYCPQCHRPLRLCGGRYRGKYFAHFAQSKTKVGSEETNRHQIGKKRLRDYFVKLGLTVETEYYFPKIKRRGDVVVWARGEIYVIEYQCSPITVTEIRQRTYDYHQVGNHVYWIAGPRYVTGKGWLATVQKFGHFTTRYGWWFLAWDALREDSPGLFYRVQRCLFGDVSYLKQPLLALNSKEGLLSQPQIQTVDSKELIRQARQLEHYVLGTQTDARYLKIQQLCYERGYSLLGCPWIVHVPEACTDFVHLSPPILNRVRLLIELESTIEENALKIEEVDQEFWEYLINNQWVIKKGKRWQLQTNTITWFPDTTAKIRALKKGRKGFEK